HLPISISTVVAMSNLEQSYPPSAGSFSPQAREQLVPVLKFLSQTNTPIFVNIYPYFAYVSDPINIKLDYAIFNNKHVAFQDGLMKYTNLFDAIFDAFVWAMKKEGVMDLPMVVSETGWPSHGNGEMTTRYIASTYNRNFVKHVESGAGTPKRPNSSIEGYLFSTFNENQKPEGTEQNFGLYYPTNMKPIYKMF
ncbi:PREDICTED: probable glucan endo-1,3-beta-glucosidase BG4, partial [Camelina sativa]|uniref:glucan endo-1,3-beta-D-glucosidase n=1 Tax=Camelina sativa TaxID=90675 RepID=A0ABM1QTI4_CAMSA